jgi:hypothetical protein
VVANSVLRLILAGLLAGAVMNAGEFVLNGALLSREWQIAMAAVGRPPIGGLLIACLAITTFAFGFALVWIYLVLTSRYGAGPRAAMTAGLICWGLAYGLGLGWCFLLGVLPARIYWTTLVWAFFEVQIASFVAAYFLDWKQRHGSSP